MKNLSNLRFPLPLLAIGLLLSSLFRLTNMAFRTFAVWIAVLAATGMCAGFLLACGSDKSPLVVAPDTPTAEAKATAVPAATSTHASPAITNRLDCDVIRGTEYLSADERTWFLANCITPTATPNPKPLTALHRYEPQATGAAHTGTGDCWTTSIASGRDDAFRCHCNVADVIGNIFDPCFALQSQSGLSVACGDPCAPIPFLVCSITEPLPTREPWDRRGENYWYMVVDDHPCEPSTGTSDFLNGEDYRWICGTATGRFDCNPPEELEPGRWFATCATETTAPTQYFVSEMWN